MHQQGFACVYTPVVIVFCKDICHILWARLFNEIRELCSARPTEALKVCPQANLSNWDEVVWNRGLGPYEGGGDLQKRGSWLNNWDKVLWNMVCGIYRIGTYGGEEGAQETMIINREWEIYRLGWTHYFIYIFLLFYKEYWIITVNKYMISDYLLNTTKPMIKTNNY